MTRRALGASALALMLGCGGASGGAPGAANAAAATAPKQTATDEPLAAGWTNVQGPGFSARMPAGYSRNDGMRELLGEKNSVKYTLAWSDVVHGNDDAGNPVLDPDAIFDRASRRFFDACAGSRLRIRRDDTLDHKTATVDGTCSGGKPGTLPVLGQIHLRGDKLVELYAVVSRPDALDEAELRGFFRAFRTKSP